jgi:hypothetical protein
MPTGYRNGSRPAGLIMTNPPRSTEHPTHQHPTSDRPRYPAAKIISRRRKSSELVRASEDPELIIKLRREFRDVGQRRAIHGSDRNCTTETAGPEGAPRLQKILN